MKSTILITKINRAVETGGAVGDGATLANLYAEAVNAVNARMDAVVTAMELKQASDAVRIMEDEPRLLDEINALDFMRLPDWEVVCERNGWTKPPKIDRDQLERVMMAGESVAANEAFMKMYRKAVRTNDTRLAVKSLRHLAKSDPAQDWAKNLARAEATLQRELAQEFEKARQGGDATEAERIAREFLSEGWLESPAGRAADAMRSHVAALEASEREREGAENIALLRKCLDGEWNLDLASAMIQAIDRLAEAGWNIPAEEQRLVEECRSRCCDEVEAREREAEWKEHCGELHTAVQRDDVAAIRDALSWPGFNDREPPEDLLRDAQIAIEHEEARRRRKMRQVTACVVFGLASMLGVSTWLLRAKMFNDRCRGEAEKLEALAKEADPIERLRTELARLERDEPKVFADGRVGVFTGRLSTLVAENAARTNELVSILTDLEALMANGWKDSSGTTTGKLDRAKALVKSHDHEYDKRLKTVRASYLDFQDKTDTDNHMLAEKYSETLLARMKDETERLKQQLAREKLESDVAETRKMLEEWDKRFAEVAPELNPSIKEAEVKFAEAETMQKNLRAALETLKEAKEAKQVVRARADLLEHYGGYDVIAHLKPLSYGESDAAAVLDGTTSEKEGYGSHFESGVSDDEFKNFLEEKVVAFRDIPSCYSLYGVYATCWPKGSQTPRKNVLVALARGKPTIGKGASYKVGLQVSGDLIDLSPGHAGERKSQIEFRRWKKDIGSDEMAMEDPVAVRMGATEEIMGLVDLGEQTGLTLKTFESEILKRIKAHLAAAHADNYLLMESDAMRFVPPKVIPAGRRVRFVKMYLDWLKNDLKLMPEIAGIGKTLEDQLAVLAQPVKIEIEDVPDDLTWACLYEPRARARNVACAKFLAQTMPTNFLARYEAARDARAAMKAVMRMKVEPAGKIQFDPFRKTFAEKPGDIYPDVMETVANDHPLYILRKEEGHLHLKKALIPQKGRWAVVSHEVLGELVLGEPLFQISFDGALIDMEAKVMEIAKGISDEARRYYLPLIPYLKLAGKEGK